MKKKERRSCCPVACSLDLLGDKWTLLIIRDLFCGKTHFRDFMNSPEKIASNILTDRMQRLIDAGLVKKQPSPQYSGRDAYVLSKKGKSLWPVLEVIAEWGLTTIRGTEQRLVPIQE